MFKFFKNPVVDKMRTALRTHLLLELTQLICHRSAFEYRMRPTVSIGHLVVAGGQPLKLLCKVIEDNVWITRVLSGEVRFEFQGAQWQVDEYYLINLFTKWVRKLYVCTFESWHQDLPRKGFLKIVSENRNIEELSIGRLSKNNWPLILDLFPKLVSVTLTAIQFADMLKNTSIELSHLKEVQLKDNEGSFEVSFKTVLDHRTKLPQLEDISYVDNSMTPFKFPDSIFTIVTLKYLTIGITTECCAPLDFSYLAAASKLFPALKSVNLNVDSRCQGHPKRDINSLERLYEAFHALRFDFFLDVQYHERLTHDVQNLEEVHQYLAAKGKSYGSSNRFTVETFWPKKVLIHTVIVNEFGHDYFDYTYFSSSTSDDFSSFELSD